MSEADIDCDQMMWLVLAAPPPTAAADPSRRANEETSSIRSAAQTCFSDGLHSIFAFLTLCEFAAASHCCRSWSAAASTQSPLSLPFPTYQHTPVTGPDQLRAIAHSHLARHIDTLHTIRCLPRELSSVLSLCCRLPQLSSLALTVADEADEPDSAWWGDDHEHTPLQMPHTLRKLEVKLSSLRFQRVEWSLVDSVFARLLHDDTPPLTALQVEIDSGYSIVLTTQIPVDTLRRLLVLKDSLTELSLLYMKSRLRGDIWIELMRGPGRWTQEHIDVFRQLTRLVKLDPFNSRWSDEELVMLCAEPAPAHLRLLPLNAPPETAAGGEALTRLPLAEVHFRYDHFGDVNDLSFLRRISTLASIRGDLVRGDSKPKMESVVDILTGCTRCTSLTTPQWMTDAHLYRLLPSLPHLRVLHVQTSDESLKPIDFGGLSFASSSSHLAHTLERLHVTVHKSMPLSELRHLHSLRSLRHLDVYVTIQVLKSTSQGEIDQVRGEFDTRRPETFRRDRWPHMVESSLSFFDFTW